MKPVRRIIVIDDDPSCRVLLASLLQRKGYEVISLPAPTACPLFVDARCSCPKKQVCGDFLLTDNRMPGMTGLEFVERQARGGCKGIIANKAVLSGSWNKQELSRAERLGCQVFTKPFDVRKIVSWLEEREKRIPPGRQLVPINGAFT